MEARDLMTGDYLKTVFSQKIVKVKEIKQNCIYTEDNGLEYNEIEPIPITPEILEKNGFIKDKETEYSCCYHILIPTGYERTSYTIQFTFYKVPICGVSTLLKCWGWIPPKNSGMNDIHLCNIDSVHQLQHALRLCGIKKEIEI